MLKFAFDPGTSSPILDFFPTKDETPLQQQKTRPPAGPKPKNNPPVKTKNPPKKEEPKEIPAQKKEENASTDSSKEYIDCLKSAFKLLEEESSKKKPGNKPSLSEEILEASRVRMFCQISVYFSKNPILSPKR